MYTALVNRTNTPTHPIAPIAAHRATSLPLPPTLWVATSAHTAIANHDPRSDKHHPSLPRVRPDRSRARNHRRVSCPRSRACKHSWSRHSDRARAQSERPRRSVRDPTRQPHPDDRSRRRFRAKLPRNVRGDVEHVASGDFVRLMILVGVHIPVRRERAREAKCDGGEEKYNVERVVHRDDGRDRRRDEDCGSTCAFAWLSIYSSQSVAGTLG
ncbi:hypothetical protein BE221DRAFT_79123 [Ostreococcus tauri]|uniref:Uncharacterized protein n=1 Tax=Ostreococcus tauri TaxID=70448 RepID=A0A1Y5I559_OSTTA|nr:hypothetical protein BE221DRAFT_79123 [Ostreococcus tauri]